MTDDPIIPRRPDAECLEHPVPPVRMREGECERYNHRPPADPEPMPSRLAPPPVTKRRRQHRYIVQAWLHYGGGFSYCGRFNRMHEVEQQILREKDRYAYLGKDTMVRVIDTTTDEIVTGHPWPLPWFARQGKRVAKPESAQD